MAPAKYTSPAYYDNLIRTMPAGLERAVVQILKNHIGKENALHLDQLAIFLIDLGFHAEKRQIRIAIRNLRREQWLIGALPSEGYYIISSKAEFNEFVDKEFKPKITDMAETLRIMRNSANERFGEAIQGALL
jgi:hypothetical protein